MTLPPLVWAFLGGVIPAFFWLWFWLREDKLHPEPRRLVIRTFVAGMLLVPVALFLQWYANAQFSETTSIFAWVVIEEVLKYGGALVVVLWHCHVDEPIDYIIYMITIALGFSALENALFIFTPISAGDISDFLLTGNFRFLGATLLHVLSSGTIGVAMALAYYKKDAMKILFATLGLFIAIVLHAIFNFFIIKSSGGALLNVFLFVWLGIIILFFAFEKVKLLQRNHNKTL
ncbi:PrsW family intramembrane metalloprotease [Candidatus Kaiserbacteria bacterium]|nr:PrsW family intramembrane metalloprotease [Candidatus Kaiserbacteria bacterium]